MRYTVHFLPEALKALRKMSPDVCRRVMGKIEKLQDDLTGDVKRLTHFTPEYRLRVGDWRVLFEIVGDTILVYTVLHRSSAYGK